MLQISSQSYNVSYMSITAIEICLIFSLSLFFDPVSLPCFRRFKWLTCVVVLIYIYNDYLKWHK
jgi:hypothetical protein